jgi:hypothetical protein
MFTFFQERSHGWQSNLHTSINGRPKWPKLFLRIFGEDGPSLHTDIEEIEDNAVLAATAVFDAVIARALQLQNHRCSVCDRDFFPQRETLRLDNQNRTPRARRRAVDAGATKSLTAWARSHFKSWPNGN